MNEKIIKILSMLLSVGGMMFHAPVMSGIIKVNSEQKFSRRINNAAHPFCVVLFYENSCSRRDSECRNAVKGLLNTFKLASDSFIYRQADVQFLAVDVSNFDLQMLARDYRIERMPAYMLFKNGNVVRNDDDKVVCLVGEGASVERLKGFVNEYLDDDLQDRVDMKADERARRAEALRYYWATSPYWYGGYGYGYGYPYWGGYGPRASFGFSL